MRVEPEGHFRDAAAAPDGFVHLLQIEAGKAPGRVFARFEGTPITLGTLVRQSDSLAAELRRRGINRGDRIAVMLRNGPAVIAVVFALAKAGIVWVPVNVRQRGDGLRYLLEHSDPRLLIVESDLVETVAQCGARVDASRMIVAGAPEHDGSLARLLEAPAAFRDVAPTALDPLAIMYTSGTTGRPKGVVVSHAMLRKAGEAAALVSAIRAGDVLFVWEPLFHIGGAQLLLLPLLEDVVLAMTPAFSASKFWSQVRQEGATHIHYLGGLLQMLLKQPTQLQDRTHPVRVAWGGGCPADVWTAFQERFGVAIRECYGLTETASIATINRDGPVGSVGRPAPWFDVDVRDDEDRSLPAGQRGMIVVKGKQPGTVFENYFRDPEATARAFRGELFLTGDIGSRDESGNLFFHGRGTDSVRCKGENVSAWEVEHVAARHPAIQDCAMVGVPSDIVGHDIKLFMTLKSGAEFDLPAFSHWLGERLAPYQNPRYLAVIEEFERTSSERIMKHRLPATAEGCWDRLSNPASEQIRRAKLADREALCRE